MARPKSALEISSTNAAIHMSVGNACYRIESNEYDILSTLLIDATLEKDPYTLQNLKTHEENAGFHLEAGLLQKHPFQPLQQLRCADRQGPVNWIWRVCRPLPGRKFGANTSTILNSLLREEE